MCVCFLVSLSFPHFSYRIRDKQHDFIICVRLLHAFHNTVCLVCRSYTTNLQISSGITYTFHLTQTLIWIINSVMSDYQQYFVPYEYSEMNHFPVQALQYHQCIEIMYIIHFRHFKCTAKIPVDNSTTNNTIKMRWCFIWSSCLSDIRLYPAHSSECKNIKNIFIIFPLKVFDRWLPGWFFCSWTQTTCHDLISEDHFFKLHVTQ